ncbi:hypothetical protein [Hyalangium sp.]|uniref:hypothetical protein n=1 Tax=Hyalangium sp. TaxID=2028555 RepID=UPI00389B1F3E
MMTVGEKLREQGRQQGLVAGRAEGVLRILTVRGIAVDEETRKRILSCTDLPTLDQWFDRALTAARVSDLMTNG